MELPSQAQESSTSPTSPAPMSRTCPPISRALRQESTRQEHIRAPQLAAQESTKVEHLELLASRLDLGQAYIRVDPLQEYIRAELLLQAQAAAQAPALTRQELISRDLTRAAVQEFTRLALTRQAAISLINRAAASPLPTRLALTSPPLAPLAPLARAEAQRRAHRAANTLRPTATRRSEID